MPAPHTHTHTHTRNGVCAHKYIIFFFLSLDDSDQQIVLMITEIKHLQAKT